MNHIKEDDKKVWVEVEVNKFTDGITVFRGRMAKAELEAWTAGELVDCMVKLEKTYWFQDERVCMLGYGDGNGKHYTGDTYIRVDTIMLVFVLKDESYPNGKVMNLKDTNNVYHFPGRE